jgi:hypothetical protein
MFIARKEDGSIYGTWTVQQWDGQEELPDDHDDVVAFVGRPFPTRTAEQKLAAAGLSVAELKTLLELE